MRDATRIAATLGCAAHPQGTYVSGDLSPTRGANGVLALCRRAGVHGKLALGKNDSGLSVRVRNRADVVGNLLFGLLESDGWVSREQTGALRVGFSTTSEQLAHQIHWLLLRFGIAKHRSRLRSNPEAAEYHQWPTGTEQAPNVRGPRLGHGERRRIRRAVPMWGPRGIALVQAIPEAMRGRRRGSQATYLAAEMADAVLNYLDQRGVTARDAADD